MAKYKKDPNEITFDELDTLTLDELGKRSNGCFGFYDWFCKKTSLKNRAERLIGVLCNIADIKSKRFDPKKCYVFFMNNYPSEGGLYDDLRICDKKTGDVIINVCPSHYEIWHASNSFKEPIKFKNMKELYAWFKENA